MGAAQLTQQFRSGALSPVEVTQSVLQHAQEVQARLNAFTLIDHQGALDLAKASEKRWRQGVPLSPIDGVSTTIKDLVWFKGRSIRYGSLTSAAEPCAEDAPCVNNLRANGAVFIGVTTSPEMGWKAVTDSKAFGITRNPWNPEMTSGGSSGGAAVAAATGAGVLHVGTDGGGSIRIPASFCGIVGHKPTFGTVPAFPASAFGTVAHVGPMARTVDDVTRMLSAMSGRDLRDWAQGWKTVSEFELQEAQLAKTRIGYWSTPASGALDSDISRATQAALERLRAAGASIEAISLPEEKGGGLVVGVIRDADHKSLRQISADTKTLAEKARTKGLSVQDMSDATFTISNLGMFGVEHFTAIINPPNSAILACGAAVQQPVVRDGQLVVGTQMQATLSLDHRVIDGAMAAQYLASLKEFIEEPETLVV
jgi:Asp-tRNA(Asn)/Glu-tRNA(Gln) amidotransferase A subunit family amidase